MWFYIACLLSFTVLFGNGDTNTEILAKTEDLANKGLHAESESTVFDDSNIEHAVEYEDDMDHEGMYDENDDDFDEEHAAIDYEDGMDDDEAENVIAEAAAGNSIVDIQNVKKVSVNVFYKTCMRAIQKRVAPINGRIATLQRAREAPQSIYALFMNEKRKFNSGSSVFRLPSFPSINQNGIRSFTFWAKFDRNRVAHAQCIFSIGRNARACTFNIVRYNTGNRAQAHFGVMGYGYDYYPRNGRVRNVITNWNFFCVVYDGKKTRFYVNGRLDNIDSSHNRYTTPMNGQVNYIGKSQHSANPFFGYLSKFEIYTKVLNINDTRYLYEKNKKLFT